jgi:formylglycine-generating enzyme required for sulfatase activity
MKFVPIPGTKILFGVWDVRVQDFDAFVKASGYDATGGMYSYRSNNKLSQQCGDTWANPGFNQEPTCPVVGVSWEDAKAFCEWLTRKERGDGTIKENQAYRLPLVVEWDQAVGLTKYPWGASWPPPSGAGNYAGSDLADADWNSDWGTIDGYRDRFARTSPVGSFRANQFGLYDMGGNVRQFCEDMYLVRGKNTQMFQRSLRGASWIDYDPEILKSAYNLLQRSDFRMNIIGFRCVLAPDTLQSPAPSITIVDIN